MIWSCSEDFSPDNPLDPENPEFITPEVSITSGPSSGEVLSTSVTSFSWEGNKPFMLFKYAFDQEWGSWTDQKTVQLTYLDEGDHNFSIKSTYTTEAGDTSGHESEVSTIDFKVDAVDGPAIVFYPRRHVASIGDVVNFKIFAEEVENLSAVEMDIAYDKRSLTIIEVTQGNILQTAEQTLFHTEIDSLSGGIHILAGLMGSDSPSFFGTSDILSITVKIKEAGLTYLTFEGKEVFKDANNNTISILEAVNGLVEAY